MTVLYVVPPIMPMPSEEFERAVGLSFSNVPHARLVKIEENHHYIEIDQPERFVA